jgi:phosphopentomutase
MFTGRDVTKLGITTNTLDASAGLALAINGATTMFQWTKVAGGTSAALVGTSTLPASDVEQAKAFFGIDEVVSIGLDLAAIREQALAVVKRATPPTLTFVHIPTVDFAGHDHGWITGDGTETLGAEYADAAAKADAVIAELIDALRPAIESGDVALIVTADHGGGHGEGCAVGVPAIREHCTAHPGDVTIPFVLWARDIHPGRIAGRPTIMQVAPTVARLIKLAPPRSVPAPVL